MMMPSANNMNVHDFCGACRHLQPRIAGPREKKPRPGCPKFKAVVESLEDRYLTETDLLLASEGSLPSAVVGCKKFEGLEGTIRQPTGKRALDL